MWRHLNSAEYLLLHMTEFAAASEVAVILMSKPDAEAAPMEPQNRKQRLCEEPKPSGSSDEEMAGWDAAVPPWANIKNMPDEILLHIFSYLDTPDLGWSACVCKRWSNLIIGRKNLWRNKPCVISNTLNSGELMAVARALPPLDATYLFYGGVFGLNVGWPVSKVYFAENFKTHEPFYEIFNAPSIVMDSLTSRNIANCMLPVKTKSVVNINVVEPLSEPNRFTSEPVSSMYAAYLLDRQERRARLRESLAESENDSEVSVDIDSLSENETYENEEQVSSEEDMERKYKCPNLKNIRVLCESLPGGHLENLCRLGPVCTIAVESCGLSNLYFLYACRSSLMELSVSDCSSIPEQAFNILGFLKQLRKIHLYNCRVRKSVLQKYVKDLPHLTTFEVLPQLRFSPIVETRAVFLLASLLRKKIRDEMKGKAEGTLDLP